MDNICDHDEGYSRSDAWEIGWCMHCCNEKCSYKHKKGHRVDVFEKVWQLRDAASAEGVYGSLSLSGRADGVLIGYSMATGENIDELKHLCHRYRYPND